MTHANWKRGLILFWTTMLGITGMGGIILAVLEPPKPMREAANRTSPPRVAEPSKQPVDRFPASTSGTGTSDGSPSPMFSQANYLPHSGTIEVPPPPPAKPVIAEANPVSPAAASPQNFKFRIRASTDSTHEARARELASKLQSNFNRTTEWQSEPEVPATAVIRYPAAIDHATAMDAGRLVGSLGYAWHVEKLPAKFTDATIDIWLPNGKPTPSHRPASKPGSVASRVPTNKLIWSPSQLPASRSDSIASGSNRSPARTRSRGADLHHVPDLGPLGGTHF
jgi:hypothetical protein